MNYTRFVRMAAASSRGRHTRFSCTGAKHWVATLLSVLVIAVTGLAQAQPDVTITGTLRQSIENLSIGNPSVVRAGLNKSENRMVEDSTRIIFSAEEDMGGGWRAVGRLDMRMLLSAGTLLPLGNTFVGLRSATLGGLNFGRRDIHYYNTESTMHVGAADLRAASTSILAYAGGGTTAIAGATRTGNIAWWHSPNWNGFTLLAGYSFNPSGPGADLASAAVQTIGNPASKVRAGSAWAINPNFRAKNWNAGWSHWNSRPDGGGNAYAIPGSYNSGTADQSADRFYGSYKIDGLRMGFAWDKSRLTASTANAAGIPGVQGVGGVVGGAFNSGTVISRRVAWSIPVSYEFGMSEVHLHYSRSRTDTATSTLENGARMFALSYQYKLSKRTGLGLTYSKIVNGRDGQYNFFTSTSLGSANAIANAGEAPRLFALSIAHSF